MAKPFSALAFEAWQERARLERGSRILKQYSAFIGAGFDVAYIYVAAEPILVIRPIQASEGAGPVGIRRRDIADYLTPDGGVDHTLFDEDAPQWLAQMGKENTQANRSTIGDILTHCWSDIYNTRQDDLTLDRKDPVASAAIVDANGNVLREQEV